MFLLGAVKGASERGSENFDRIREKAARQIEEARVFAQKAKAREAEANEIRSRIGNASKSYGVNENLLLSAYKDGNLDTYLKGIEAARERAALTGQQLSPEILESYYSVPRSAYEGRDVDEELRKIFGVIETGVNNQEEIDDATLSDIIMSALGGDDEGAVRRRNRRETVEGYDLDTLMNLPTVGPVDGDGGTFSDDFYGDINRKVGGDGEEGGAAFTEIQNLNRLVEEGIDSVTQMGGAVVGEAAQAGIRAELSRALAPYVIEEMNKGVVVPTLTSEIMDRVIKTGEQHVYIRAGANLDGKPLWNKLDKQTGVQIEQLNQEELETELGGATQPAATPEIGPADDLTSEPEDDVVRAGNMVFRRGEDGILYPVLEN